MSYYPCDFHGRRVPGSLSAAYITAMDGTARYQRRLRLCSKDLVELHARHGAHWVFVAPDGDEDLAPVCAACGAVPDERGVTWSVFATLFPKGEPRQDFFAGLHEHHAEQYITELGLKLDTRR